MDIKENHKRSQLIKKLDKGKAWTERIKDPAVDVTRNFKPTNEYSEISDFGDEKVRYYSNRIKDETIYDSKKLARKTTEEVKKVYAEQKNKPKGKNKTIKNSPSKIKESKNVVVESEKTIDRTKKAVKQTKEFVEKTTKKAVQTAKEVGHAIVVATKAVIDAVSSLITLISASGGLAAIVIIIICLVGLLCASMFGIFFSNETNSVTINEVIKEVNTDIHNKINNEIALMRIPDYEIDSSENNWKEVIAIYSVKYSDSNEDVEPILYLNDSNISKIKKVYWDMNDISYTPKYIDEKVIIKDRNGKDVEFVRKKQILSIEMTTKSLDNIMNDYNFNSNQREQVNELLSIEYEELWRNLLYGSNSGEFVYWRQHDPTWGSIRIGNTTATIDDIGCLVTSIAILIEKSGSNNTILPFNPGTFVTELNRHNGFDEEGNLKYGTINDIVPNFEFVGHVNLKDKSKSEKLSIINEYILQGYYLSAEVKGDTGQHWVAILDVNGNNITMVDPGTNHTDMWNIYKWQNTSQFVYFKIK